MSIFSETASGVLLVKCKMYENLKLFFKYFKYQNYATMIAFDKFFIVFGGISG